MLRVNARPSVPAKASVRPSVPAQNMPKCSARLFQTKSTPRLRPDLHSQSVMAAPKQPAAVPVSVHSARPPARLFATDREMLGHFKKTEIKRVSVQDPRANELIVAVRHGDYSLARVLVKNQGVNVDGHNSGENTALADAASRGDTKAVRYLIKELKANPNASCDCPAHRTALHYAAKNGHKETVKALLECGASLNALDSYGKSAIAVAKNEDVKKILIDHQEQEREKLQALGMPARKSLPK